jgi:hypothetical protein
MVARLARLLNVSLHTVLRKTNTGRFLGLLNSIVQLLTEKSNVTKLPVAIGPKLLKINSGVEI